MPWYYIVLLVISIIVFSPIIILGILIAFVAYLVEIPRNKKAYAKSAYFRDFNLPYKRYILYSPEYRFYNTIIKRKFPLEYTRQASNGLEYFMYGNTLFLFPDFDQIAFSEEKQIWEADYDGDWKPFEEAYNNLVVKIDKEIDKSCIKLLVERKMFPITDLNGVKIPDCIYLTWSYESAFQNDESPLMLRIPTNAEELIDMMKQTPELCGEYHIADNGNIVWDLYESIQIHICVDPRDCYIGVNKKAFGKVESEITHWHPTIFEMYDEVCKIGKRGNVLVIRTFFSGEGVLYIGDKENCTYKKHTKKLFSKLYYLEAK